jgi:aminoacyl-tRNA hydrolase
MALWIGLSLGGYVVVMAALAIYWTIQSGAAYLRASETIIPAAARPLARGRGLLLVKPQTYVNLSGRSLGAVCRYFRVDPVSSLIVVYDEINIDLGRMKISVKGSAGGHNGLISIIQHLGSEFLRFRIGIGDFRL